MTAGSCSFHHRHPGTSFFGSKLRKSQGTPFARENSKKFRFPTSSSRSPGSLVRHTTDIVNSVIPSDVVDNTERPTSFTTVTVAVIIRGRQLRQLHRLSLSVIIELTYDNFQMTRSVARFL